MPPLYSGMRSSTSAHVHFEFFLVLFVKDLYPGVNKILNTHVQRNYCVFPSQKGA